MRTLLIDGDILAYQTAAVIEKAIPWDDDGNLWTVHYHPEDGYSRMDSQLSWLKDELSADRVIICLSDPVNFRYTVYPDYKSNRKKHQKPVALQQMKDYLAEQYESYTRPGLEADDVMGILATNRKIVPGEKVIVSIDKDMLTIPAAVFNLNKARQLLDEGEISSLEEAIVYVSQEDADRYHLYQTLIGDVTDGYPGCPGVGPESANKILDNPVRLTPVQHELKRGPRKGETETRWAEDGPCSPWEAVVSHYRKAGLNEAEALIQARVARILRNSDYNFKTKEPIMWCPN